MFCHMARKKAAVARSVARRVPAVREKAPDIAEVWKRIRAGKRQGHYYAVLVGITRTDTPHVIQAVRDGLPYEAFERLQRNAGLSQGALASVLAIPERTLARRKDADRLEPEESDRLLRLSRILARAVELFEGDNDAAAQWLTQPQKALGGQTALRFAATDAGALEVEHLIGRLEHGIAT